MTAAELSALSDQQLSDRVAVEVAGWTRYKGNFEWDNPHGCPVVDGPCYAVSADAVLPLLEKYGSWGIDSDPHVPASNRIRFMLRKYGIAVEAPTVPRAICLALLLAKGAA